MENRANEFTVTQPGRPRFTFNVRLSAFRLRFWLLRNSDRAHAAWSDFRNVQEDHLDRTRQIVPVREKKRKRRGWARRRCARFQLRLLVTRLRYRWRFNSELIPPESWISFHYRGRAGLLDTMACRVANRAINDRTFIETFSFEVAHTLPSMWINIDVSCRPCNSISLRSPASIRF